MLTTCESTASITLHLREVSEGQDPNYDGNSSEARTLCNFPVGWDTKIPVTEARCYKCREIAGYPLR